MLTEAAGLRAATAAAARSMLASAAAAEAALVCMVVWRRLSLLLLLLLRRPHLRPPLGRLECTLRRPRRLGRRASPLRWAQVPQWGALRFQALRLLARVSAATRQLQRALTLRRRLPSGYPWLRWGSRRQPNSVYTHLLTLAERNHFYRFGRRPTSITCKHVPV
jgi:hypothetical protein